jgi:hypothetical protein
MQKVRTILAALNQLAENSRSEASRAARIAGTREHSLFFGHYTLIYRMRGPVFEVLGILPAKRWF